LGVLTVHPGQRRPSGTKVWEGKTGGDLRRHDAVSPRRPDNSNGIEGPTPSICRSPLLVAAKTPWGVDSQVSALDYFLNQRGKLNPGFQV
jgi:hypothetical protein